MHATKLQSAQGVERQMKQNTVQGVIPDAFTARTFSHSVVIVTTGSQTLNVMLNVAVSADKSWEGSTSSFK